LRAHRERPRRRTAEQRDEVAAFHSITSSAVARSVGGTSRPRTFAVLMPTCAEFVNPPIWPSYKQTIGTLACGLASCTPLPAIGDGP
jgi:hypothetical protein